MAQQCELKERAKQPTLMIRTTTSMQDLSNVLGKAYGAIVQYLGSLGVAPAGPPLAVYYNMDMENLDIGIGFPVAKALPGEGKIQAGEIPAGKYASCLYTGPYDEIGDAYDALTAWVEENDYEATGLAYEFYLNDPNETPPEALQTQILFPLKA
jgi:effector-binding domain-containing protein